MLSIVILHCLQRIWDKKKNLYIFMHFFLNNSYLWLVASKDSQPTDMEEQLYLDFCSEMGVPHRVRNRLMA